MMRTIVTLDESLVNELMSYFKVKTKTAAAAQAVKEQIRGSKLKRLAKKLGTIAVDEETIWAQGCQHGHDICPSLEQGRPWGTQPNGWAIARFIQAV